MVRWIKMIQKKAMPVKKLQGRHIGFGVKKAPKKSSKKYFFEEIYSKKCSRSINVLKKVLKKINLLKKVLKK